MSVPKHIQGAGRPVAGAARPRLELIAALALACAAPACAPSAPADAGDAPAPGAEPRADLVLILIDTLRPDHLQPYGYEAPTSPFLARLADRAVVFERAFSTSSWTAPATASVFTGLYPNEHGVVAGFRAQRHLDEALEERLQLVALPADRATLPELLADAGYATFGLASNINVGSELGFDRGFEQFERLHRAPAAEIVERVLAWRAQLDPERPYFLYLHLNDVHMPYEGRPEFGYEPGAEGLENQIAAYDSEIRYLDHWLGELDRGMGWAAGRDTFLMLVSDHGEEFLEHGAVGHRFSLHAEVNDVLMMVAAPGAAAGARVGANASLVDVLPTLLDAAGLEPPPGLAGRSLAPLLAAPAAELGERALFAHRVRGKSERPLDERRALWAIVSGPWKLLLDETDGSARLYDTAADPGETEDLAAARPELVERLRAELETFRSETVLHAGSEVEVLVDQELLEHLRELGYAGQE